MPPTAAQMSLGFTLLWFLVISQYFYTHISLISKDKPTHTETQCLVKTPNISRGLRGLFHRCSPTFQDCWLPPLPTGTPPGTRCACCHHSCQVGPFCVLLMWLSSEPTFHSSACRSLNLSSNFCEFPWLPPPYLLCLPPAHLQHPPPHSCFRTQLLLFPKKSVYIKHFVFLLPHSLPFVNLIDNLYDRERTEQEFKGTAHHRRMSFHHPLAPNLLSPSSSLFPPSPKPTLRP